MSLLSRSPYQAQLRYLQSTLWDFRWVWLIPAVAGLLLAAAYALFLRGESWSARQSFVVRDDLLGQAYKPGRFESQESMKSAQETILEISRRPQVIRNALEKLGPETSWWATPEPDWISDELIEDVQGRISFSAPNGEEFGKTEVIVLTTEASSRERSRQFIELLSEEIITMVNQLRSRKLQGMEAELERARDAAMEQQRLAMNQLEELDLLLGPDVGVMNALNDSQAGETPMKREISQIKAERRQLETELEMAQTTLVALRKVHQNPEQIIYLSSDILRQQPALETMKKELVELQQALAESLGPLDEQHPRVIGLRLSVKSMEATIYHSLVGEIDGVEASIVLKEKQLQRLSGEIETLQQRLITLSSNRAEHLRLTSAVKQLTDTANRAQSSLAEIRSLTNVAKEFGFMTPVDEPQVSAYPDGISRKMFACAGGLGGLMLGLGCVVLLAPPMSPTSPTPSPGRGAASGPARVSKGRADREAAAHMRQAATMPDSELLSETLEATAARLQQPPAAPPVTDAPAATTQATVSPLAPPTAPSPPPQTLPTSPPLPAQAGPRPLAAAVPQAIDEAFAEPDSPEPVSPEPVSPEPVSAKPTTPVADMASPVSAAPPRQPSPPLPPRQPATRPVDLLKSAAAQDHFLPQPVDPDRPIPTPPTAASGPAAPSVSPGSALPPRPAAGPLEDVEDQVPDQIRKLNETIARFVANPGNASQGKSSPPGPSRS